MTFCSAINCMDGRVQLPVIHFLRQRFNVDHVDAITEPGPNRILSDQAQHNHIQSILDRLDISLIKHNSVGLAVVGHHDCAGNPAPPDIQQQHTQNAIKFLNQHYDPLEIIGLWVDEHWNVHEIE